MGKNVKRGAEILVIPESRGKWEKYMALVRAANERAAQQAYIEALVQRYKSDTELSHFDEVTLRLFAERHVANAWPEIIRLPGVQNRLWCYRICAGPWAAELSGILGGDLNLHCGEGATLSTTGLIGICGAAIAADIGGTLRSIEPVTFCQAVAPGEPVEITIRFENARSAVQYFTMTGHRAGTNIKLFKPATITMIRALV